ncbi:carboxylesterase family protein [Cupriavidus sp. IDO]|uniref:carboxylesterase family protein n=1 Tax=Cupriavidus sp. IDO TaxID=1539142 RepID=UPI00187C6731|nr:carboxylesterase family protein [Cupriavidus sp. IDO]
MYERFDRVYTDAVFAEPVLATAKRLLFSGHRFHCYRFDRVSSGAAASNFRAQHTAELRYPFGTLTADGYDETDKRISAWMQMQGSALPATVPPDDTDWRHYGEDEHMVLVGDEIDQGRIEDDSIVSLLHSLRTDQPSSPAGFLSLCRRLWR